MVGRSHRCRAAAYTFERDTTCRVVEHSNNKKDARRQRFAILVHVNISVLWSSATSYIITICTYIKREYCF